MSHVFMNVLLKYDHVFYYRNSNFTSAAHLTCNMNYSCIKVSSNSSVNSGPHPQFVYTYFILSAFNSIFFCLKIFWLRDTNNSWWSIFVYKFHSHYYIWIKFLQLFTNFIWKNLQKLYLIFFRQRKQEELFLSNFVIHDQREIA